MISKLGHMQGHGSRRLPWHTFALLLITLALYAFVGPAAESIVLDRQAIGQGELWRLVTGHWAHGDMEHLTWNLVAFGIMGTMIETSLGHARLHAAVLAGTFVVTAWIWLFIPDLELYCGLSGVLNTLLFVILIDGWLKTRKFMFLLVFVAATTKIAIESVRSTAVFTHTSWPAVPEAHLAGALAGLIMIAYLCLLKRIRRYGGDVECQLF